jgi:hypothetical protein
MEQRRPAAEGRATFLMRLVHATALPRDRGAGMCLSADGGETPPLPAEPEV